MIGVEAGGHGVDVPNGHAASMTGGRPGVLHGNRTYLLQDDDGQILEGHSISAGLDYPGIGPEHAWLHDTGRVTYVSATDKEALDAFQLCTKLEGIIPALEPAHALAYVTKLAPTLTKDEPPGDEYVRQRRQGYLRRRRSSRDGDVGHRASCAVRVGVHRCLGAPGSDETFARLKAGEGRAALVTFITAGDPDYRDLARSAARDARRRRRHHRTGNAVLRPDGRRPGDPGVIAARAQRRA